MSHMLHASDLVAMLPAELAANYNGTALQRDRLLHCLRLVGPAGMLGPELARVCNVPSITKRISELRRAGHEIDTEPGHVVASDGSVSACARYVLRCADDAQGDLFTAVTTEGASHA
jgi:hypothetical protein